MTTLPLMRGANRSLSMFSYAVTHALLLLVCQALAAPRPQGGQSSLATRASVQPVLRDCPVWPGPESEMIFDTRTCVRYRDVTASGAVAQVYGEVLTQGTDVEVATKSRLGSLKKTLAEALSFYAANLDQKLNVKLTVVRAARSYPGNPVGLTIADPATGTPCHIAIWIKPSKSDKLLAHTIAHELYHCVQRKSKPQPVHGWVEDGSANFMEYFQYSWNPAVEEDSGAPHHYNPSSPLYSRDNQYTSSLFFMFRHNLKFTLRDIDKWVQSRVDTPADRELEALAQDHPLADSFARFAVKFHNKGIRYDSAKGKKKMLVTSKSVAIAADVKIDLPSEGAKDEQRVTMKSWTFQKYNIQLVPGQTVSAAMDWTHDSQQPEPTVVIWRRIVRQGKSASAWSRFRPGILQSGCSKTLTSYEFLVVPVTKEASVDGYLRFARQKDAKCACAVKNPGPGPAKRLLPGPNLEARQEGNLTNHPPPVTWTTVPPPTQLTMRPSTLPTPTPTEPSEGQDWPEGETDDSWRDQEPESDPDREEPADETDIDDTGSTDDENPSCEEPLSGPSCLIGTWKANKASMDAHFVKPEYAYYPHGYLNTTFSGSLTFTFGQDPAASNTSMMLPLRDKLIEEQLLIVKATDGPQNITWFMVITSILDGFAAVSTSNGFHPLGPESGVISRNITNSTGSAEVSSGPGETPSVSSATGKRTRPQGTIFAYNCTASTLYYTASYSTFKSYVFDRV